MIFYYIEFNTWVTRNDASLIAFKNIILIEKTYDLRIFFTSSPQVIFIYFIYLILLFSTRRTMK